MSKLPNIIAYICESFSKRSIYPLTNARLTKLVYLTDWLSCLNTSTKMTDIDWKFYHYGPYVEDVINTVKDHPDIFNIQSTPTDYGTDKQTISLADTPNKETVGLDSSEKDMIDIITEETKDYSFSDFIDFVYKSYPIASTERYSMLDLPNLAAKCRKEGKCF